MFITISYLNLNNKTQDVLRALRKSRVFLFCYKRFNPIVYFVLNTIVQCIRSWDLKKTIVTIFRTQQTCYFTIVSVLLDIKGKSLSCNSHTSLSSKGRNTPDFPKRCCCVVCCCSGDGEVSPASRFPIVNVIFYIHIRLSHIEIHWWISLPWSF